MENVMHKKRKYAQFTFRRRFPESQHYYDQPIEIHLIPEEVSKKTSSFFSFGNFAKLFASLTVLSGVLGVCYQKGMIATMHLGNMAGSYDVKEIFSSALQAYYNLFNRLYKSENEIFFDGKLIIALLSCHLAVTFFVYVLANKNQIEIKINSSTRSLKKIKAERSFAAYTIMIAASILFAVLFKIFNILAKGIFIFFFALLLIPSLIGYKQGEHDALEAAKKDVCIAQASDIGSNEKLHQCTHLVINQKTLSGEILLQNSEGYFMRINNAFIYSSKDGKTCVYSQDKQGPIKADDKHTFENAQLENFCLQENKFEK
ncbi:MAG TPA: hypothetical protein VIZ65_04300 [Cellvibrionaceae bacterium]